MNNHTQTPGNPAQNPAIDAPHGANDSGVSYARYESFLELYQLESLVDEAQELIGLVADYKNSREDSEFVHEAIKSLQASLSKKLARPEKHEPNDEALYQLEQQIEAIQGGAL